MRIGIDARELCGRPTGVGRYLKGLLSQWARPPVAQAHQFVLFVPNPPASPPPSLVELRIVAGGNGTRWEQLTLPGVINRAGLDVFFAPGYSAPLRATAPVVLTMHDLSFVAHPEWFRWRERVRRTWLARRSARKARVVLAISEFIRDEIVERLGVHPIHIRVIPHGLQVPGASAREDPAPTHSRAPVVLFTGSIFNRRHVPDLIHAFAQVSSRHPEARLEIVGENRTHPHQDLEALVRQLTLGDRVHVRSYEPDEVVGRLYRSASVFAFLSEYEGFGLPPLEALASGMPIVLTDTQVAREVFGNAARYVPRGEVESLASQLEALLFDSRARREILDRAPAVLARYSWERAAGETLAALEEAAATPDAKI